MEESNLAFKIESWRIDSRISLFIIFLYRKKSSCHKSEELKKGVLQVLQKKECHPLPWEQETSDGGVLLTSQSRGV